MAPVKSSVAACVALALVAIATGAHAQQARPRTDSVDAFAAQPTSSTNPTAPHRTLQWDAKTGRWGLSLDMTQHTDRDMQWKDVAPGLYYRATPRLRVGAGVSLSNDSVESTATKIQPQPAAPRVRLETTFKF
jgi:hypothetical protein